MISQRETSSLLEIEVEIKIRGCIQEAFGLTAWFNSLIKTGQSDFGDVHSSKNNIYKCAQGCRSSAHESCDCAGALAASSFRGLSLFVCTEFSGRIMVNNRSSSLSISLIDGHAGTIRRLSRDFIQRLYPETFRRLSGDYF